jgi:sulfate permease, SulP family
MCTHTQNFETVGSLHTRIQSHCIHIIISNRHHGLQALPVTIAFARITYSHPTFSKVQAPLSRLLIAANGTHALVGALLSRLPFAVAQVQDLGLIFLNAMTSDIAKRLEGQPHEVIVGTAMMACSLATMLLGVVLIIVGRCVLPCLACHAFVPEASVHKLKGKK